MVFRILILPKEGLLDPQGRAVEEMLREKGYKVKNLKVGKVILLEMEEREKVLEVAKLLTNELIEDFFVEDAGADKTFKG